MRIDITEKNMVWLVEHKMADTIVAEFHRKETVIESLIRERDEAKAELASLRASSFVTAVPVEEYEKLKAEVERLRKAGDAMVGDYLETGVIFPPSQDVWNAAKEGKPQS